MTKTTYKTKRTTTVTVSRGAKGRFKAAVAAPETPAAPRHRSVRIPASTEPAVAARSVVESGADNLPRRFHFASVDMQQDAMTVTIVCDWQAFMMLDQMRSFVRANG